jgi:hypothetical protein
MRWMRESKNTNRMAWIFIRISNQAIGGRDITDEAVSTNI